MLTSTGSARIPQLQHYEAMSRCPAVPYDLGTLPEVTDKLVVAATMCVMLYDSCGVCLGAVRTTTTVALRGGTQKKWTPTRTILFTLA